MKEVIQILAAIVFSVGAINFGNVAGAACNDIEIVNTGAGSQNQIVCVESNDIVITCDNDIFTGTANIQQGTSGQGTGSGNTTVGTIATGTVVNYNGTDITIGVTSCQSSTQPVPTTPETPTTPQKASPVATIKEKPAVLPYTSTSSPIETIMIGIIALATIAATIKLAITTYRRATLK